MTSLGQRKRANFDSSRHHQASIISAYGVNVAFKHREEDNTDKLTDIDLDIFSLDEKVSEEKETGHEEKCHLMKQ